MNTEKLKIACIGNMNNNMFVLVRHLRDTGYDAHLFTFLYDSIHFLPEADTFNEEYKQYTHTLNWPWHQFSEVPYNKIRSDIKGFDYYIACGYAPAFLDKAGILMDIFMPYGSDLYEIPFYKFDRQKPNYDERQILDMVKHQRHAIRNCRKITSGVYIKKWEEIITNEFHLTDSRRVKTTAIYVYNKEFSKNSIQSHISNSNYFSKFKSIRDEHDFFIFHHARHVWKTKVDDYSWKGNDVLIKGFADFINITKAKAALILFEYGPDVAESKKLINDLKIADSVFWFGTMPRKEILLGLSLCDIATGEFTMGWYAGGTIMEGLALGKPIMHYRDDKIKNVIENKYPLINVKTDQEISAQLQFFYNNKQSLEELSQKTSEWYNEYGVNKPLNVFLSAIQSRTIVDVLKRYLFWLLRYIQYSRPLQFIKFKYSKLRYGYYQ